MIALSPPWLATANQYAAQLIALAGRGLAWQPQPGGRTYSWWLGTSAEFATAHAWLVDLVAELDPSTATDALGAWETSLGLPESGYVIAATDPARRLDILAKLFARAVVTEAQWIAFAESAGYAPATVTQGSSSTFNVNSTCSAYVTGPHYDAFVWILTLTGTSNAAFEALATKMAPAHTSLRFVYV